MLIAEAEAVVEATRLAEARRRLVWQNRGQSETPCSDNLPLRTIDQFRADAALRYGGDQTRVDLAYAIYALSRDVPVTAIEAALASRDLTHKGDAARQAAYIARTLGKARACRQGVELAR